MKVTATDFQNNTAKLMKISLEGEEIIITKHGHQILKLSPLILEPEKKWQRIWGCMEGTAHQLGDIMEPIEDIECTGDWENIEPFLRKKND